MGKRLEHLGRRVDLDMFFYGKKKKKKQLRKVMFTVGPLAWYLALNETPELNNASWVQL